MLGLLTVVLTVAPVDAVVSRSIDTTPERAQDLLERVTGVLTQAGIPMRDPIQTRRLLPPGAVPSACAARRACVRELGVALGARAIVSVDVGHVTGQMAVNLEAVATADGARLAQHSFTIDSAGYPAGLEAQLKIFARALKATLQSAVDAPVAIKLEPAPKQVEAPVIVEARPRPIGPFVLGGSAVVAAVVAIALGVVGASTAAQLERAKATYQGAPASSISRAKADALAGTANGEYAAAGVCAGAAVALGAGALLSWKFGD